MKDEILINTPSKKYKIIFESNSINKIINLELKNKNKTFIIVDKKIKHLLKNLNTNSNTFIIKIKGDEKIKSINEYWNIISVLLKNNIDRSSTLIAIGGGTVGDLSGFIASTILRGIRFILIPTTLLSQVDSSIGGKNGINSNFGKNLVGTFLQPDKVIIDTKILNSLPKRQIKSGYAEIVKHAIINDKKFFNWLNINSTKILNLEKKSLEYAITKSIKIKSKYVTKDEKEKLKNSFSRSILNFGHTFGHALETMNKYESTYTHGEAIAVGMCIASKISLKLKNITNNEYEKIINHFKKVNLPTDDKRIYENKILKLILLDKKNSNKKINLVLLKKTGEAYLHKNLDLKIIKKLII